ncbi:glycosyltransferase family 4 protein [Seonamhaeicola aphaedonensis]|uniref:Glycosyltransferase involved in cell wall biosynthesis n=1 Tax=Seonamhaeicola aphaedonensis TaxID=1461338 RepID=A0A3D9HHF6_9FLAO|nr:glycosyltransferase family 4 protein [Seonamhaeicola aphaedonensis]RED48927.1 glycosyltransferase involved in cell wall biosynthesis [Seonamhaeicola aphaedonensis]
MRDLLIITNYYPPETGAAANRIFHLADGFQKRHFNVSVLTPLPNYPKGKVFKGYRGTFKTFSVENEIKLHRLWIYACNSKNKVLRLLSMVSYSISLILFFCFNKVPKTVIIQSPPLLVAFTSIFFLRSKSRKLILNVSDLWPIAGLELGAFKKNFGYTLLEKIERFNYKNADLVLGQSHEILDHIKSLFPEKETFLYRNYPKIHSPKVSLTPNPTNKIKLVYAGLLGVAQGIYKLCHELDYSNLEFHIYGDGAERSQIEGFIKHNDKLPLHYHGEISRSKLHKVLLEYDVTIIPLLKRIYGSVPSKIFEYSKLGIPTVYFGGGEGETIIKENNLGWIAQAGNYTDLNNVISNINISELSIIRNSIKKAADRNFDFDLQFDRLIKTI